MPAKKKTASAPANRVYKAVAPKRQTKLSSPKKDIKSYGTKAGPRSSMQDTLTQMDFVRLFQTVPDSDEEDIEDSEMEEDSGNYDEEEEKRSKRRRRTIGDGSSAKKKKVDRKRRRRTLGDEPTESKRFHTQTMTQMDWSFSTAPEKDGSDHEDSKSRLRRASSKKNSCRNTAEEDETAIYAPPISSSSPQAPKRKSAPKAVEETEEDIYAPPISSSSPTVPPSKPHIQPTSPQKSGLMGPPPKTPIRAFPREIPSSQSPATPASNQFQGSGLKRSPLREQSTNIVIPFNITPKAHTSPQLPRRIRVEDTFESGSDATRPPSTPEKRYSPAKSVRFAILEEVEEDEMTPTKQAPIQITSPVKSAPVLAFQKPRFLKTEISDSDAESDDEIVHDTKDIVQEEDTIVEESRSFADATRDNESAEEATGESEILAENEKRAEAEQQVLSEESGFGNVAGKSIIIKGEKKTQFEDSETLPEIEPETCYGELGLETQFEAEKILSSSNIDRSQDLDKESSSPTLGGNVAGSQDLDEESSYPIIGDYADESQGLDGETQKITFSKSQYMESQRLNTQQVNAMAPRTAGSDIFISIHPSSIEKIVNQTKDHEFRAYKFPPTVRRVWIYETRPSCILRYMAVISDAKQPGEILDESGFENDKFNAKPKGRNFAYEILALYELSSPRTLEELILNEWIKSAPSKTAPVRPAVLDELMSNLLPPIFTQASLHDDTQSSPLSEGYSHKVEAQMLSTIRQFIQPRPSEPPSSPSLERGTRIKSTHPSTALSTPQRRPPTQEERPSQAETVDLTQPSHHTLPEVVCESPTRPVIIPSSTPIDLPTPHNYARYSAATPVPYSIASSQLLTKSQMLPESLMEETQYPGPPDFVGDSENSEE